MSVEEAFAADGPLAAALDDFRPRDQQRQMAVAVEQALLQRSTLIVEAGTGVGKTFAYLLPALLSGRRVVISTGTRTLQDQLYSKDLPLLRRVLGAPVTVSLLKGRNNYLCLYRVDRTELDPRFDPPGLAEDLLTVRRWAGRTRSGDRSELDEVPADRPVWSRVTSTGDNCLGQECPSYGDCFLMAARRRAQEADIIVVNHYLLLAHMALKDAGHGEVLPAADAYILDEAHQLPEIARTYFGASVGSRQVLELARDLQTETSLAGSTTPGLGVLAERLRTAVQVLRLALGTESGSEAWVRVASDPDVEAATGQLLEALMDASTLLKPLAPGAVGVDAVLRRTDRLHDELMAFAAGTADVDPEVPEVESVLWFETRGKSFQLRSTPLDVGPAFQRFRERQPAAWVLTSATLSVAGDYRHFRNRLDILEAEELTLDSPFDYARQARLYLPSGMPDPGSGVTFDNAFLEQARAVIACTAGRAFLLFTSHRALRHAAEVLQEDLGYPLLIQGTASQHRLLEEFRRLGNAVLLGTASFWEGVDVKGSALSAVLIDRLPFASPGDPVLEARIARMRQAGSSPFAELQMPLAVTALRQGVGRLIRDASDRGIVMLADPRLRSRGYGRLFLASLPPIPVTERLDAIADFMADQSTSA